MLNLRDLLMRACIIICQRNMILRTCKSRSALTSNLTCKRQEYAFRGPEDSPVKDPKNPERDQIPQVQLRNTRKTSMILMIDPRYHQTHMRADHHFLARDTALNGAPLRRRIVTVAIAGEPPHHPLVAKSTVHRRILKRRRFLLTMVIISAIHPVPLRIPD